MPACFGNANIARIFRILVTFQDRPSNKEKKKKKKTLKEPFSNDMRGNDWSIVKTMTMVVFKINSSVMLRKRMLKYSYLTIVSKKITFYANITLTHALSDFKLRSKIRSPMTFRLKFPEVTSPPLQPFDLLSMRVRRKHFFSNRQSFCLCNFSLRTFNSPNKLAKVP